MAMLKGIKKLTFRLDVLERCLSQASGQKKLQQRQREPQIVWWNKSREARVIFHSRIHPTHKQKIWCDLDHFYIYIYICIHACVQRRIWTWTVLDVKNSRKWFRSASNSSIEWMVRINEPNHLKWQKKTFWNILNNICISKLKSMIWKFSAIFLSFSNH